MSDKYIIKNCDAFCPVEHSKGLIAPIKNTCINYKLPQITKCENITDCKLKQIVEKCKLFQNNYLVNDGVQLLTTNILNSLDIQEVE